MTREGSEIGQTARLMLKLGCVAFGGPAAHIAMLEDEVVERRRWMTREHFLDLVGATSIIPGPNSTEMMMHVGIERHGWRGLVLAGLLFVLPAAVLTSCLAWLYASYGTMTQLEPVLWGIRPAVLVIILAATWRLGTKALVGWRRKILGGVVAAAVVAGLPELVALLGGAVIGTIWLLAARSGAIANGLFSLPLMVVSLGSAGWSIAAAPAEQVPVSLVRLGLFFLKVGAVLYGSGYVLVAFLEGDLVGRFGWLTSDQLMDAIAVGQMTPGPVLTTATFVGFVLGGLPGASVATVAIFLPSLVLVAVLNPLVPKLRRKSATAAFLDAVNASAVALMAAVTLTLGREMLTSWQSWVIAGAAAVAALGFRISPVWLVVGGGVLGFLLR